ncbi:DUF2345 domain-containing protein [Cupriavidus basilensis]
MQAALAQLQSALAVATGLQAVAERATAELAEVKSQQAQLESAFKDLQKAVLLLSAPEGIGAVTAKSIQLASGEHLSATTGGNADFSVGKSYTVAAGQAVSLFAQRRGIRALAANGPVDLQAQGGAMQLFAEHEMKITSADGRILATAGKAVTITAGGAYIKLEGGNIELGCPGDLKFRSASFSSTGPSSLQQQFSSKKILDDFHVTCHDAHGEPISGETFTVLTGGGSSEQIATSGDGTASLRQILFDHFSAKSPQRLGD